MRLGPLPPNERHSISRHLDALLDEALKETFPASDPVAITLDRPFGEQREPDDAPVIPDGSRARVSAKRADPASI